MGLGAMLLIALVPLASGASLSQAKFGPGSLDRKFGHLGRVVTPLGWPEAYAAQAALQPDGKIDLAGSVANVDSTRSELALVRYKSDGSLDPTFGSGGKLTSSLGYTRAAARGVALQADGKIVIAALGAAQSGLSDFTVVRFNSDGSLDTSFGTSGKVVTAFGQEGAIANKVLIQPDGKIVVAGTALAGGLGDFALARYTSNGSLDKSFGTGGKVTTSFGTNDASIWALALAPDGKIVAVGQAGQGFALARYNPNGTLDATFGSDGTVVEISGDPNTYEYLSGLALQQDGKIVAAGSIDERAEHEEDGYFVVLRYSSTGKRDPSFGLNGTVTVSDLPFAYGSSVALQPDGKILAAGSEQSPAPGDYDFLLARYRPDGTPDPTFGARGRERTDFSCSSTDCGAADDFVSSLLLEPSGDIVLAGSAEGRRLRAHQNDFALARYLVRLPRCTVPKVVGRTLGHARGVIGRSYCNLGRVKWVNSPLAPRRRVLAQRPAPGTRVRGGTKIRLVVSRGTHPAL